MRSIKQHIKKIPVLGVVLQKLVAALQKMDMSHRSQSSAQGWAPRFSEGERVAAEHLVLPENTAFQAMVQDLEQIEGMLSPFSMAVMNMLLSFQHGVGSKGDILEIGTYRGKSAALLGRHLRSGERLTLVDVADYLEPKAIAPFAVSTDFILAASSKLRKALPGYFRKRGTYRFIHIDASHGYDETFDELSMADELLAPAGLIAMDDFTNLNFSQNIAAIFRYLYTARTDLVMLMVTDEKGYLCRKNDFKGFVEQIFKRALAEMKSRGIEVTLARTSQSKDYHAFYLRNRAP